MINEQALTVVIDGRAVDLGLGSTEPLVRAVIISLFTWRRANADDTLPSGTELGALMGWWGDSFPNVPSDLIGSRLWLLLRAKLTPESVNLAKEYVQEALGWLVQDGVASRVDVEAERQGLSTLALACRIYKTGGAAPLEIRFTDVWKFLNV